VAQARTRLLALVAVALAGVALSAVAASPSTDATPLTAVKHVFVIVLENEAADTTFGASSPAPYLASTMVGQGAFVPNYFGIGHSSLDNYIAMISGQPPNPVTQADCGTFSEFSTTGATTSDGAATGSGCVYPSSVSTLANQLESAGLTWRGYMDSMGSDPSREATTCGHPAIGSADNTQGATATDQYATRHDPFMYFHSIIDDAASCSAHVVPFSRFATDLGSAATTPNFSFITPSLCNDGHDAPCANGQPGGLTQVNTFLSTVIPEIEGSAAYKQDGLIITIFDESEGTDPTACCNEQSGPNVTAPGKTGPGGGRTGAVLISPFITPGTTTQTAYNHYSLLRSIEDIFGLSHLGYAAQSGLAAFGPDIFTATPATTSTSTTTNATTTTTTTTKKPPACSAASGFIIASAIVTKTATASKLVVSSRRAGTLTFQVHPATGAARTSQNRTLACKPITINLPAGHGTVKLSASAGKYVQSKTTHY